MGKLVRSSVALLATLVGASLNVTVANAATPKTAAHGLTLSGVWVGSYNVAGTSGPVYAVNFSSGVPSGGYVGTLEPSTLVARQVGRLVVMEAGVTDNATQAEVAALVSKNFDAAHPNSLWNLLSPAQRSTANSLWNKAVASAGPYTPALSLPVNVTRGTQQSGTVTVTSSSGALVAGMPVTLASSSATLAGTSVVTNANGQATFSFVVPTSTPGGTYTISASVNAVSGVTRYSPTGSPTGRSSLIGAAAASSQSASGTASFSTGRLVTLAIVDPSGNALSGVGFTVLAGGSTVASGTSSSSANVLGMLNENVAYELKLSGLSSRLYSPTNSMVLPVGASVFHWTAKVAAVPTISLLVRTSGGARMGTSLSGSFSLRGNDGESGVARVTLYGPVAKCSGFGPVADTYTVPTTSATTYPLKAVALTRPGCYHWRVEVVLDPSKARSVATSTGVVAADVVPRSTTTTTAPRTTTTTTPRTTTTLSVTPVTPASTTTTWQLVTPTTTTPGGSTGPSSARLWLWGLLILIVLVLLIETWRHRRRE